MPASARAGSKRSSARRRRRSSRLTAFASPRRSRGCDRAGQAAARGEIDVHAEEVAAPFSARICVSPAALGRVAAGDRIRSARALEKDDRLEHAGVDSGPGCRPLGERQKAGRALRRRRYAAGALRVQHLRVALRGCLLEARQLRRGEGEWVARQTCRARDETRRRRAAAAQRDEQHGQPAPEQTHEHRGDREPARRTDPAGAGLPFGAAETHFHRSRPSVARESVLEEAPGGEPSRLSSGERGPTGELPLHPVAMESQVPGRRRA